MYEGLDWCPTRIRRKFHSDPIISWHPLCFWWISLFLSLFYFFRFFSFQQRLFPNRCSFANALSWAGLHQTDDKRSALEKANNVAELVMRLIAHGIKFEVITSCSSYWNKSTQSDSLWRFYAFISKKANDLMIHCYVDKRKHWLTYCCAVHHNIHKWRICSFFPTN